MYGLPYLNLCHISKEIIPKWKILIFIFTGFVEPQISHFANFTPCKELVPKRHFWKMWNLRMVNFDNFGGLTTVLKSHIFLIFNCEKLVRIRVTCVRFFLDVKNWYSFFINVKNRHQFFTPVKNWYSVFTNDFEWQSGHYFVTGATCQINMSLRNMIHYMETRGSSGQGMLIENGFI